MKLRRREFIKLSAAAVGALSLGGGAQAFSLPNPFRGPPGKWFTREVSEVFSVCENCVWRCGIKVFVEGGKVRKIDGYVGNPKSNGRLCPRGHGAIAQTYDPDRLKRPLIRAAGSVRGEGKYREASWDEAFSYIAEKMLAIKERYGSEAVAFFGHGTGDRWFAEFLPGAWGSPNAAKPSHSLCVAPRETASIWTFGRGIAGHEQIDWGNTDYMVLLGHHIGEDTHNTQLQDFAMALKRGAKLVVVDPRFSTAASKADRWLPIKPGTDTALLLAWLHVLVTEELYDRTYIEKYTLGFEELVKHVQEFTPEWAAAITDLPAETIRIVARELATHAPRAVLPVGRHVVWYGNDTQRMRAFFLVNILLGNYGVPGGYYLSTPPVLPEYPHPPLPLTPAAGGCAGVVGAEVPTGFRPAADRNRFFGTATAIQELIEPMITGEPYPIKGLWAYGINLFHTIPNVPRTKEALRNLDLYVAIDVLPMEHVMWADVILPEATYLERYDDLIGFSYRNPFIQARFPAVEPLWETKPGWWIARELGIRLGLGEFFPWEDFEQYLDTRLRGIGSSLEAIRAQGTIIQRGRPFLADWEARGRNPFNTPSGKIEIFSQTFADNGFDPLPVYTPPAEGPSGYYRLLYGRSPVHTFARTHNNPILMEMHGENALWLNADEAIQHGLRHGDYVWLENQDGVREGPIKIYATQRIRKDCVYMVHGFGHRAPLLKVANSRGACDNRLITYYTLDVISGGAGLRNNFVRIIPGAPRPRHTPLAQLAERSL